MGLGICGKCHIKQLRKEELALRKTKPASFEHRTVIEMGKKVSLYLSC
jgi:hypothetical protein